MARSRDRKPGVPERLEERLALSTVFGGLPRNTLGAAPGVVSTPGGVAEVHIPVRPKNLTPNRVSTIIGLSAAPGSDSALLPAFDGAEISGNPVALKLGAQATRPGHPAARAYARVPQAGPLGVQITGRRGTTGGFLAAADLPGDLNGDGVVNFTDLKLYQSAYLSTPRDAFYNPAADANRNGFVGMGDGKFLVRNIPPTTPKIPLRVDVSLAPGQYAPGTQYQTSGGVTRLTNVTVIGRTTPGSIVFSDSGLGDYTFNGPALATDENGFFAIDYKLDPKDNLKNTEYLVIDPFGQTTIRAFPILLIPS